MSRRSDLIKAVSMAVCFLSLFIAWAANLVSSPNYWRLMAYASVCGVLAMVSAITMIKKSSSFLSRMVFGGALVLALTSFLYTIYRCYWLLKDSAS